MATKSEATKKNGRLKKGYRYKKGGGIIKARKSKKWAFSPSDVRNGAVGVIVGGALAFGLSTKSEQEQKAAINRKNRCL